MQPKPITLDKAKVLLTAGWLLKWKRTPDGLDVWVESGTDFHICTGSDFPALAAHDRDAKRTVRREHTRHTLVFNSSAVYSYGYDRESEVFEVRFTVSGKPRTKGALYRWHVVPIEVVTEFELARSKGGFLASPDTFRGRYEGGLVPENQPQGLEGFAQTLAMHGGGA